MARHGSAGTRVRQGGTAALWRFAGTLGRSWRLHKENLPPRVVVVMVELLVILKEELMPEASPGGPVARELLVLLARLAGSGKGSDGLGALVGDSEKDDLNVEQVELGGKGSAPVAAAPQVEEAGKHMVNVGGSTPFCGERKGLTTGAALFEHAGRHPAAGRHVQVEVLGVDDVDDEQFVAAAAAAAAAHDGNGSTHEPAVHFEELGAGAVMLAGSHFGGGERAGRAPDAVHLGRMAKDSAAGLSTQTAVQGSSFSGDSVAEDVTCPGPGPRRRIVGKRKVGGAGTCGGGGDDGKEALPCGAGRCW